jgi:PH (Pleckstrin Homology) domain-containing protein
MDALRPMDSRGMTFPGRHDGEPILLLLRRHWFVLVPSVLLFLFLAALPFFLRLILPAGLLALLRGSVWEGAATIGIAAYYLFLWLFFFTIIVDYYLDVWIVTDERIVNIEQVGLFRRVISEQRLIRVQDVTSDVRGILPTFLNFGNVYVQTAAERERFIFLQVPRPTDVEKLIIRAHEEAVQRMPGGTAEPELHAAHS